MDRDKENKVKQANGIEKETLAVTPLTSSLFTPSSSLSRNNGADGVGPILPLPPCSSPSKLSAGKSPSQAQQSVSLGRSTVVNVSDSGDKSTGLSLATKTEFIRRIEDPCQDQSNSDRVEDGSRVC